jgi:hypothetical protein
MAATLITVADIASLMIKREKDRCRLKAMRRAIKAATFKRLQIYRRLADLGSAGKGLLLNGQK